MEICTRNWPLSETKFWMISGGPFLSQPLCFSAEFRKEWIAILCKILTRMKLLFLKLLGNYSYSFQGSSE